MMNAKVIVLANQKGGSCKDDHNKSPRLGIGS